MAESDSIRWAERFNPGSRPSAPPMRNATSRPSCSQPSSRRAKRWVSCDCPRSSRATATAPAGRAVRTRSASDFSIPSIWPGLRFPAGRRSGRISINWRGLLRGMRRAYSSKPALTQSGILLPTARTSSLKRERSSELRLARLRLRRRVSLSSAATRWHAAAPRRPKAAPDCSSLGLPAA